MRRDSSTRPWLCHHCNSSALGHRTRAHTRASRRVTRSQGIWVPRRGHAARASRGALTGRPLVRAASRNRWRRGAAPSWGTRPASRRAGRRCACPRVTATSRVAAGWAVSRARRAWRGRWHRQ